MGRVLVFLLAGQSNMVGGASMTELPASLAAPQPDVLFSYSLQTNAVYESPQLIALRPTQVWGQTYGPELSFGRALADALEAPICLVKVAANGSSLADRWGPDDDDLYDRLVQRWESARDELIALGHEPVVAGFCWVQGVSDANDPRAPLYLANLNALWSALQSDIGLMPFLQSQQHPACPICSPLGIEVVRAAKWELAEQVDAETFETADLTMRSDLIHYTGAGTLAIGTRLAAAYLHQRADSTGDDLVGLADLLLLLNSWGACPAANTIEDGADEAPCPSDISADGNVNVTDLLMLLANWG